MRTFNRTLNHKSELLYNLSTPLMTGRALRWKALLCVTPENVPKTSKQSMYALQKAEWGVRITARPVIPLRCLLMEHGVFEEMYKLIRPYQHVAKRSAVNCQTWQALHILYPESSVTMLWGCLLCCSILRVVQVCTFWEDKKRWGLRGRECLRSRVIRNRVLCWENLVEHRKGLQCREEQMDTLRFGASVSLSHWQCSNTNIYNDGNLCNIYRTCNPASLEIVKNADPSQSRWELAILYATWF